MAKRTRTAAEQPVAPELTRRRRRRPPPGAEPGAMMVDPEAPPPLIDLIAYGPDQVATLAGTLRVGRLPKAKGRPGELTSLYLEVQRDLLADTRTLIAGSGTAGDTPENLQSIDDMIANVCKHHVTKMPYEIGRLAQDLAGGLMVTMPSEKDLENEETGALLRKYLKGRSDIPAETRMRILRLIENMTLGRNAVGYLTESMHGAGSPQAQRIQIARTMKLDEKKARARRLAGVTERTKS